MAVHPDITRVDERHGKLFKCEGVYIHVDQTRLVQFLEVRLLGY